MAARPVRLLRDDEIDLAFDLLDRNPAVDVFVRSRLEAATADGELDRARLGGQLWAYAPHGDLEALCFHGASVVPVAAGHDAVRAFVSHVLAPGRRAFSVFGPADAVLPMWELLEPSWGRPRDVRRCQPLLSIDGPPLAEPDPEVRRTWPDEIDIVFPASVAMFTEEVGVSPLSADGGASYRARLRELIADGRSYVRIDDGRVIFKAEVGCVSELGCQIQGVWVPPDLRGRGIGVGGMATVVALARRLAPLVTLYVNDFNGAARAVYERVGFQRVGTFATVLL
jgi:predicted GNAT family acetyltransferase